MSLFLSMDLAQCRKQDHQFKTTWSDKDPMKVSLMCITCTLSSGKNAYVAYGDASKSFGAWRRMKREIHEPIHEELPD